MTPNSETTREMTEVLSEHQRLLKLEHEDIPVLRRDLAGLARAIEDFRKTRFWGGDGRVAVPVGLFGGAGVLAAANGVPLIYATGKTFGPGGKQVAQLKFSLSLDLEAKPVGDCVEYKAKDDRKVKLTIVHSDGTTQTHTIAGPAAGAGPDDTRKVVVCLDPKTGTPGSIYIT